MPVPSQIAYSEVKQTGCLVDVAFFAKPIRVIALFEHSLYLETADNRLVCLSSEHLALGPLTVSCSNWEALHTDCVFVGQTLLVKDFSLILHARAVVNIATMQGMVLPCAPDIPSCDAKALAVSLASLQTMFQSEGIACKDGFAPLIPLFLFDMPNENKDTLCKGNIFLQEARALVAAFMRCVEGFEADTESTFDRKVIVNFIGLGPGLTPSGDDFIVGVMLALRHCRYFALLDRVKEIVCSKHAATLTNKISYAYLQAGALGHTSSVLHDVANDFCVGSSRLHDSLGTLQDVGHSSGWDAFAGFVITMKTLASKGFC